MRRIEAHLHIGKRVIIPNRGDIAINSELKKYIYDEEGKYELILDRVTKGGRLVLRDGKHTYSLAPKHVELL